MPILIDMALTITMAYLAHRDGTAVETLAQELEVPVEWLQERLEAARLCCEHQVRFIN